MSLCGFVQESGTQMRVLFTRSCDYRPREPPNMGAGSVLRPWQDQHTLLATEHLPSASTSTPEAFIVIFSLWSLEAMGISFPGQALGTCREKVAGAVPNYNPSVQAPLEGVCISLNSFLPSGRTSIVLGQQ